MKELVSVLFILGLYLAAIVGWILNIVTLCHFSGPVTAQFVLRVVGIFVAPLGSILGYLS